MTRAIHVHVGVGHRRPPRQDVRPDHRRGARRDLRGGPEEPGRVRVDVHHRPRRRRRRDQHPGLRRHPAGRARHRAQHRLRRESFGFDGNTCGVITSIDEQSPDIAQGVDKAEGSARRRQRPVRRDGRRRPGDDVRLRVRRHGRPHADADLARAPARAAASPRSARPARSTTCVPTARPRSASTTRTASRSGCRPCSSPPSTRPASTSTGMMKPDLIEHVIRPPLPEQFADDDFEVLVQPDRRLRARRSARRLRAHRPQDHRRHLRRHGPPRRRRVQRQGPDQGRPLGRVRGAPRRRRTSSPPASRSAARCRSRTRSASPTPSRSWSRRSARPRSTRRSSPGLCRSTSTCARPRSSSGSTCAGRSSATPRRTATSAAPSRDFTWERTDAAAELARRGRPKALGRAERARRLGVASGENAHGLSGPARRSRGRARVRLRAARRARRRDVRSARSCGCRSTAGACAAGWSTPTSTPEVDAARLRAAASRSCRPGRPPDVVDLCRWARGGGPGRSRRSSGPRRPPNVVPADGRARASRPRCTRPSRPMAPERRALRSSPPDGASRARSRVAAGRAEGSTIVVDPDAERGRRARAHAVEQTGREVVEPALRPQPRPSCTAAWAAPRAGACVVVGGRTAVWAPVPDLARGRRARRGRRGARRGARADWNARDVAVERCRRAGARLRHGDARAPTVDALVARRRPDPGRSSACVAARSTVVDPRDEPPGQALLSSVAGRRLHRHRRRRRAGRCACSTARAGRACSRAGLRRAGALRGLRRAVRDRTRRCSCARAAGRTRPPVCLALPRLRFRAVRPGVAPCPRRPRRARCRGRGRRGRRRHRRGPDADVLVGTEAVLHRAPPRPVGLVAFLELDQELLAPGCARAEQALWLLVRPRVCSARGRHGAVLLVQTRLPEHEVVVAARDGDRRSSWPRPTRRRRVLGFPPFGGVAELRRRRARSRAACDARPRPSTASRCSDRSTAGSGRSSGPRRSTHCATRSRARRRRRPRRSAGCGSTSIRCGSDPWSPRI